MVAKMLQQTEVDSMIFSICDTIKDFNIFSYLL